MRIKLMFHNYFTHIILFAVLILSISTTKIWAGELAQYRILGLSDDSQYLAFGEYGISESNTFFSNIFIVNVLENSYVSNGILQQKYNVKPLVDQDGLHAFIAATVYNKDVLRQYNINLLNTGRLIYIQLNGSEILDSISFSDYDRDISYDVKITQDARVNKVTGISEAQYFLDVDIDDNKSEFNAVVGAKGFYREHVVKYLIRAVYASLKDDALIFIIEKHIQSTQSSDINIHYMVETLKWR